MTAKMLEETGDWSALCMSFGRVLVPYLAVLTSFLFAIAPYPDVRRIRIAKSTLQYPFAPFFFYLMQCITFLLYAYVTSNPLLATTMTIGSALGSYYVGVYYTYTKYKMLAHRYFLCGACLYLVLLHGAIVKSTAEAKTLIGVPGNVVMVLTGVSPLTKMPDIIRRNDASPLPVGMSIMNVVAGAIWTIYGIMLSDIVVIFPNVITTIVGIIQVSLILIYGTPPQEKHIV
ncbi:hypothetical protein THRCLA_08382 [Thraustotheca clavata]|uniref:Sugar transporter SWEET1 n=1 Tax=Thraustotheca clavata TaxID=74557 RepID=A0A1V9Z767_9STRA|nr:hypothetical protein THRCLA_08382 [Thraustotheca clavata]